MADQPVRVERSTAAVDAKKAGPTSRAEQLREVLGDLAKLAAVRGGLIVTSDGLPITANVPSRISAEALAALAAALGRELELGMDQLARGAFRMACFSADDGTVFLGATPIGFLMVIGDVNAEPARVTPAIRNALARLEHIWP